jgi:hypothetical protein
MAKPRPPEKKRQKTRAVQPQLPGMPPPLPPGTIRLLPMQLQIGDRLTDSTGEWEVVGPPYSTARKDRPRARPDDRPASQRRDTKLGRLQAAQCETSDRRGGQAMMRLARRASLLVVFYLLAGCGSTLSELRQAPPQRTATIMAERPDLVSCSFPASVLPIQAHF